MSGPSFDDFDEIHDPRPEETQFDSVLERALSRRTVLKSTIAYGSAAAAMGIGGLRLNSAKAMTDTFGFEEVSANTHDTITLPDGYSWRKLVSLGDPLWSEGEPFDRITRGTAKSLQYAFGDNTDGMELFEVNGKNILAVNNEYTNLAIIHGDRASGKPENEEDILKNRLVHGVTVLEIEKDREGYLIVRDSPYNRRITPDTPMRFTGPAAGHSLLRTKADPDGRTPLGTWNNCGAGRTPWGTFLTCEENFNGYFSSSDDRFVIPETFSRYGVRSKDYGYGWAKIDSRFDISKNPNEPNRVGYVVEIDPADPDSTPEKHTALGRFKHENAEVVLARDNRVVVYLGDDERGEFLYKYVSERPYIAGEGSGNLLSEGTLHVAVFSDDQTGKWIPLTPETTGMNKAEICVFTRMAASKVGATTMDRPEWVAVNPVRCEAYCALTNNKNRGIKTNAGGDATPVGGPNPRRANKYGQIVRWRPGGEDHGSDSFTWDLFVMAGNPVVHEGADAGSDNINTGNMFNSPDGMSFDSKGMLWIQTDGKYSNKGDFAGMGNNQMLVGDPVSGEIRRFLVGPRQAEVTGLCWDSDYRTMFVGIQHPGEKGGDSHFPDGGESLPRSTVIAIWRKDGEAVG